MLGQKVNPKIKIKIRGIKSQTGLVIEIKFAIITKKATTPNKEKIGTRHLQFFITNKHFWLI